MADRLSRTAREAFLSEVRVGVLSVASDRPDRAPVSAPVWYDYSPGGDVTVIMNGRSRKGLAIEAARRFVLVAQSEAVPYRYVAVEGPVTEIRPADIEKDLLPLAIRYLGEAHGTAYTKDLADAGAGETDLVYVMKPAHWNTADFTTDLT